jgi:integrase
MGNAAMLLVDYANAYCDRIGGSPGYREQLNVLCRRLPWHVADLSPSLINTYLTTALRQLAPTTVANHRRMLQTLYRDAVANGVATEYADPIRRVKHFFPPPRAWTLEELGRLLKAAKEMRGGTLKHPCKYSVLMPAWVLVGYVTGLRRGDLLSIRWDQIRGDRLAVMQSKTSRVHVCVLDEAALEALEKIPRYDRMIFGTIISACQIKKTMRRLVKLAGLDGTGKFLRRSSATYAELSGMSATLQLGHQTPGLAFRHYVDPVILSESRRPVPRIPVAG